MAEVVKKSVLGDLLTSVKTKAAAMSDSASDLFTVGAPQKEAAVSTSSTGLPTWLIPVVLVAAVAFVAVKFLPKLFKKGRGSRPTSRR